MKVTALVDQVEAQGRAMILAAEAAGLDAAVPTCPGWTVRDLLAHTGMVHRWATEYVRAGRAAFGGGKPELAEAPEDRVVEWFADGHTGLVAALRYAPADLDTWTFLPAPSALAMWARRQAHETAVHRADAEAARGAIPGYPTEFAADGVAELLECFYGRARGKLVADPPMALRVVAEDADRSWHVLIGPDGRTITPQGDGPVNCTLRGAAADLYLDLWNRLPAQPVGVDGDPAVVELWRRLARITWS
jgi:uncharacterized protein (TIGR03083 family)